MAKRIVITSFGSFGDVYPYIGLALGLKERGHQPVLAMPAHYRDLVQGEGVEFHAVRPDVDPARRDLIRRAMDSMRGTEFIVRTLMLEALHETYVDLVDAAHGASLLVSHPITFAAPIVGRQLGLPWVSTVLAPISFFSRHDLAVFPPMPWTKRLERVPSAAAALVWLAKRMTRRWMEPVESLRRKLGLPRGEHPLFEGQHSPRLVLALFSRLLAEPQADWPPQVRITGAIGFSGTGASARLSGELERFLAAGPPPVVFTLGSSAVGAAGRFYEESVDAVRRLGERAVLLIGPYDDNRPHGPLSDQVHIEPYAPHAALFPRASVVVHQGGVGTLHQGLRSGRPTLIVPFAHDQPDNALRAARLGASRTLRPARYAGARVARELATLLNEPSFRVAAETVAKKVRDEDAVGAACDAIDAELARAG